MNEDGSSEVSTNKSLSDQNFMEEMLSLFKELKETMAKKARKMQEAVRIEMRKLKPQITGLEILVGEIKNLVESLIAE